MKKTVRQMNQEAADEVVRSMMEAYGENADTSWIHGAVRLDSGRIVVFEGVSIFSCGGFQDMLDDGREYWAVPRRGKFLPGFCDVYPGDWSSKESIDWAHAVKLTSREVRRVKVEANRARAKYKKEAI